MSTKASNVAFLEVLESEPLENVGWTVRALSATDYSTIVSEVPRFAGMGFTVEANAEGGGKITIDANDRIWSDRQPIGEETPLLKQEALWQALRNGLVTAEWLAEDLTEDLILAADGPRSNVLGGRGTATVLSWVKALPRTHTKMVDKDVKGKEKVWDKKAKKWHTESVTKTIQVPNTAVYAERDFLAHPMAVWLHVFAEAQAEGYLDWVTPLFDAETDSAAEPWGAVQDVTVTAGEDLLEMLKRYSDQRGLSWRMLPGFRLQVFQSSGIHLESTIVFPAFRGQSEHTAATSRRDVVTDVFVSSGASEGKLPSDLISHAQDAAAGKRYRRRMGWVTTGDAAGPSGRSVIAGATLTMLKDEAKTRTIKVVSAPGRVPFIDYHVGDWVGVEVASGVEAMQVLGIAIDVDTDGNDAIELTMQSLREALAIRLQRQIEKAGTAVTNGSGAKTASALSASNLASLAVGSATLSGLRDVQDGDIEPGDFLQWDGDAYASATPTLNALFDVDLDTNPPTADQVIAWDATAEMFVPRTIKSGGGASAQLAVAGPVLQDERWIWTANAPSGSSFDSPVWTLTRVDSLDASVAKGLGSWTDFLLAEVSADYVVVALPSVLIGQGQMEVALADAGGIWLGRAPVGTTKDATGWTLRRYVDGAIIETKTGTFTGREG